MAKRMFGDATRAAKPRESSEAPVPVDVQGNLNGEIVEREISMHEPSDNQASILAIIAAKGKRANGSDAAKFIDLVMRLMTPEDRDFLEDLLMEDGSGFELTDLMQMFEYAAEEWSSRPTGRSNDSSKSPNKAGKSSTGASQRRASTRSTSTSAGSATSSTQQRSKR